MANYMIVGAKQLGCEIFEVHNGKMTLHFDHDVVRKLWDNYYVPLVKGYFAANGRFRSDDVKTGALLGCVGSCASATFFPKQVMPRYFWILSLQRARDQRKGRTKRENAAQPEKTHIRPVYYPPRQKATGIWSPGKELLSGIQKKLLPSSLRDATHSPSGTFVPPPPAGGVFLTEGGSGEKERCSILPKAPSLRKLARRKT